MRGEVDKALQEARTYRDAIRVFREAHPELSGPPDPSIDYSQFQTEEARQRLSIVHSYDNQIMACLQQSPDIVDTYLGYITTRYIFWDQDEPHHEVVIELSLFGPLAAVFVYGDAPQNVLQHIENCIDAAGLIRLTKEEINELEQRDEFLELFE